MDAATLRKILADQAAQNQANLEAQEARHKATLDAVIAQMQGTSTKPSDNEHLASSHAQRISNFDYIPEEGIIFSNGMTGLESTLLLRGHLSLMRLRYVYY
jgi:hypothetical protein